MDEHRDIWNEINKLKDGLHDNQLKTQKNMDTIKSLSDTVSLKIDQFRVAILQKQEAILDQTKRTNGSVAKHERELQELKETHLKCPLPQVQDRANQNASEIHRLHKETEPQRFANKYPRMFKVYVTGFIIVILLSLGSIFYISANIKSLVKSINIEANE